MNITDTDKKDTDITATTQTNLPVLQRKMPSRRKIKMQNLKKSSLLNHDAKNESFYQV